MTQGTQVVTQRQAPSDTPPDAFVSYAHEDESVAEQLQQRLDAFGKEVWIDVKDIPDAADWRARARAGVEAARAVLFVLSDDWVQSTNCIFELEHAVATHKRLIPIATPPEVDPATLPPALRDLTWIPLGRELDEAAITRVATALDTDLAWRDQHARLLVRARQWGDSKQDKSLLLRGRELREAEAWLAGPAPPHDTVAPRHTEYIVASRRVATRRQRVTLAIVGVALVLAIALAALAFWQRAVARDNAREADNQRRVAERNARESRSRELAATATTQLDDDPELALLLGIEAANAAPTVQAEEVLRAALPRTNRARVLVHPGLQAVATDAAGTVGITTGRDGLGRTWDLATGHRLAVLRGHAGEQLTEFAEGAPSAAVSADGEVAATADAAGDVRIWELRSGRRLHLLEAPAGGVSDFGVALAMADSGAAPILVTGGESGRVRTWDTASGRSLHDASVGDAQVTELAVSPDGRRIAASSLASLSGAGAVTIFDTATLALVSRLQVTTYGVAWSADGHRLATSSGDSFGVWDVATGDLVRSFAAGDGGGMAFSPDGAMVAIAPGTGEVELRALDSGERRLVVKHPGHVSAIAFDADGRRFVSAGTDELARLWDAETAQLMQTLRGHRTPISTAQFLGDGKRLLTAGRDGTARVWSPSRTSGPDELRGHRAVIDDLALAAGGRRVITVSEDGTARVWEPGSGRQIATVEHGSGEFDASVSVSPDGETFATAGAAPARLWRAADGRGLATVPGDSGGGSAFTLDGRYLVTRAGLVWEVGRDVPAGQLKPFETGPLPLRRGDEQAVFGTRLDGSAVIVAVPSGEVRERLDVRLPNGFANSAVAPDSSVMALESNGRVSIWDPATGTRRGTLPDEATLVAGAVFDARGDRLLSANESGVRIWDVARRRPIADLRHRYDVGSAAFSRDGRLVVTASADGYARIWEARTGRLIVRLPGRSRNVANEGFTPRAVFAPDGRSVVAATGGPTGFVDPCEVCAPLPELLKQARGATARKLTPDERLTFLGG